MDHLRNLAAPRAPRAVRIGRRAMATAAAVASIAALAAAPAAMTAPVSNVATQQVPLDVATYNIRAGVSVDAFRGAVDAVRQNTDIAGLQEVNSHAKEAVLSGLRTSGWSYYRPKIYTGEQNPVIWKTSRFQLVSERSSQIAGRWYIGNEMAGRSDHTIPIYAVVIHLRDRSTGQNISIVNTHLIPGGVINGAPFPGRPLTFKAFRASVIGLGKLAETEKSFGKVFVMGDLNIGYVADKRVGRLHMPYKEYGRRGLQSMWATEVPSDKRGSHVNSPSLIDQVYSEGMAGSAKAYFDTTFSDHYPVVARYMLNDNN